MPWRAWPVLLIGLALAARAQEPASGQRALLDVVVNEVKGEEPAMVLLSEDGDALVPVADLQKGGMRGFGGRREMHDGVEFVSVRSLAPRCTFELDLDKLAVRVTAQPSLLGAQKLDLRPSVKPAEMVLRTDTSGFLNYSVTGTTGAGMSAAAELGGTWGTNLAYTGLSIAPHGAVTRGLSNVTLDQPGAMRRTMLGDTFVAGGSLGGTLLLGGVSVSRNFSLDPYFVRMPMPRLQGAVLTPSTLDVYVNGALVRSLPVAPGTFEVQNVPVNGGAGTYSYVLRDAFGRTQEYAAPYYASPGLLSKGVSEYSYGVGLRRLDFGVRSFNYGPPALSAMHRLGIGERFTAGARFEAAVQHLAGWDDPACAPCGTVLASGGLQAVAGLPLGELSAEAAASVDGGKGGVALTSSYSFSNRFFAAGVSARAMSESYAHLSLAATADRAQLGAHGFLGTQLFGNLATSLDYDLASMRDAGLTSKAGVRFDARLSAQASFSAGLARVREAGRPAVWEGTAGLLYSFGERSMAHLGSSATRDGAAADFALQRSIPVGEGVGYQLRSAVDAAGTASGSGFVQAQLPHGIVSGTYNRFGKDDNGSATVSGALVTVGGEVLASRPVQQGYALIQVPGVPGVRGFLNNQEIGRTDGRGDLLVPELQPYYANRISISAEDLPLEYVVGKPDALIAPAFRGGAFVKFDTHRIQAVTGLLRVGSEVPAYGELTVSAGPFAQSSPLGPRGEFFLERMQPGRYHGAIEFKAGTCSFELEVPAAASASLDVGTLVCTALRPAATASQQ